MPTAVDITEQRFNRLIAIRPTSERQNGKVVWLCKCDCGSIVMTTVSQLRTGKTGSCGCYRDEKIAEVNRKPKGEASFNAVYSNYRYTAKARGLVFRLSKDQLRYLVTQNCFYCGSLPRKYKDGPNRNGNFERNGIDRIDNEKGYTLDNTVPCCELCNRIKKAMGIGEFLGHINKIAERHSLVETEGMGCRSETPSPASLSPHR